MATSGSQDFNMTRDQIISDALYMIQAIPLGHTPSAKDIDVCSRILNRLVKRLQSDHVFLNAVTLRNFNTVASTASVQLATGVKKVIGTPYVKIDGQDTPLNVISRQDYDSIVSKAAEGQPHDVFIDYSTSPPTMYFNPTPVGVYAVYYRSEDILDDFDSVSDNPDLPQSALDMLVTGLAAEACKFYRQTTSFMQKMEADFEIRKREFKAGDIARDGDDKVAPKWVV